MKAKHHVVVALALLVASLHFVPTRGAEPTDIQATGAKDVLIQTVNSLGEIRAVTPAERVRAAHFNVKELAPIVDSKTVVMSPGKAARPDPPMDRPPDPDDPLRLLACRSTAIVYATVEKSRALLNRDETLLFTDYTVQVAQWIKPERGRTGILVSASGGAVKVGNTVLRAITGPAIETGKPYLFFLGSIPMGEAFEPLSAPRPVSRGNVVGGLQGDQSVLEAAKATEKVNSLLKQCKEGV